MWQSSAGRTVCREQWCWEIFWDQFLLLSSSVLPINYEFAIKGLCPAKLPPHNHCSQKLQHLYLDGEEWITFSWHQRSENWSQSSCCIKNRGNLMRIFDLASTFNIYLLFLFSQQHYQFSCWQALWQQPWPLWSELEPWHCCQWRWGVSFFYRFVLLMELKMNTAFLCVWTVTSHWFCRVVFCCCFVLGFFWFCFCVVFFFCFVFFKY